MRLKFDTRGNNQTWRAGKFLSSTNVRAKNSMARSRISQQNDETGRVTWGIPDLFHIVFFKWHQTFVCWFLCCSSDNETAGSEAEQIKLSGLLRSLEECARSVFGSSQGASKQWFLQFQGVDSIVSNLDLHPKLRGRIQPYGLWTCRGGRESYNLRYLRPVSTS